jgi:hypothetical protein
MFYYDNTMNCVHNAYKNALIARENGYEPVVWFVSGKVKRACLQVNNEVLNEGVTWGTNNYPDFTVKQLKALEEEGVAEDITAKLDMAYKEDELVSIRGEGRFPLYRRQIERTF